MSIVIRMMGTAELHSKCTTALLLSSHQSTALHAAVFRKQPSSLAYIYSTFACIWACMCLLTNECTRDIYKMDTTIHLLLFTPKLSNWIMLPVFSK